MPATACGEGRRQRDRKSWSTNPTDGSSELSPVMPKHAQTCPLSTSSTTLHSLSSPSFAQFVQNEATTDQAAGGSNPSQRAEQESTADQRFRGRPPSGAADLAASAGTQRDSCGHATAAVDMPDSVGT
jgi:hypothetical protein